MPKYPDPGSVSRFSVAWVLGAIVSTALARALTYPFRSKRGATLLKDVLYAVVRCGLRRFTMSQWRYMMPGTSEAYYGYCKAQNFEPHTLEAQVDGHHGKVAAHWLGSPDAEVVILHFHGGCYVQSATDGNFTYMTRLVKDLNATKGAKSVAVLLPAYSLSPEARYPTALREAAAVLSHLLKTTGRSPNTIFLSGDSAGGGLAMSLLSHLLHPHPDISAVKLEQPLAGVVLYSPWVSFRTDYPSNEQNKTVDMLPAIVLRRTAAMYLNKSNPKNPELDPGPVSGDAYSEACLNPASWWSNLHHVVGDVFAWYGENEVFADAIKELEQSMKQSIAKGGVDTRRLIFLQVPRHSHNDLFTDAIMAPSKKDDSQVAIEEWLKARIGK